MVDVFRGCVEGERGTTRSALAAVPSFSRWHSAAFHSSPFHLALNETAHYIHIHCALYKMLSFVQKQGSLSLQTEFSLSRSPTATDGDCVTKPLLLTLTIACLPGPSPARKRRQREQSESEEDNEALELYGQLSTSQLQTASITHLIKKFFHQVGYAPRCKDSRTYLPLVAMLAESRGIELGIVSRAFVF